MNIRIDPDTGEAQIQIGEDEWVSIEDLSHMAGERSLRTYLLERYGKVYEPDQP